MIAEKKVVNIEGNEGITIICKSCKNKQKYTLRNPDKIPQRPKTLCSNPKCEKWIYIDRSLLVKNDQKPLTKNDQKKEQHKQVKAKQESVSNQKPRNQSQSNMTKINDQRPNTIDQKNSFQNSHKPTSPREKELNNYINGMFNEVQSYGRVIPIDTKQSIVNNVFDNLLNLTKGIKYYLNAWESRYQRYLKDKPENPLIDDYRDMQKTLEFLSKLKKLKEMIKRYRKS